MNVKRFSSLFLILFISCSGLNQVENIDTLASDAQLIWCLSQESNVNAGSYAEMSGKKSFTFTKPTFQEWSESEVVEAKRIYNLLVITIQTYKFVEPEDITYAAMLEENIYTTFYYDKDFLIQRLISKNEGNGYFLNDVEAYFYSFSNIKSIYQEQLLEMPGNLDRVFAKLKSELLSSEYKYDYREQAIEIYKVNYINYYSICKLWFEASNNNLN